MKRQLFAATLSIAVLCGGVSLSATADDTMSSDTSQQPVTDTWITTKVKTELATTDGIKSGDITVTTKNGRVILTGVVASKIQVEKAIAVARSVKGVGSVDSAALKTRD